MSDVCEHGWTRINYVRCPRCQDAERHAAELATLRDALAKAREEVERLTLEKSAAHGFGYCPRCGSCGIGGCCGHFCSFCKDRHDGEAWDLDGNEIAPHDLGDLSVNVADATRRAEAAEAEVTALREEIKRWEDKEVNRAVNCCGQEERALAAERARDEAVRERDEQARLRQIAEDAIPKGLAVGMEFVRAEAARERDEAVAARTALFDALVLLVEWGARGHNPNDIAPWIRATQVLKDARLAASTGEAK